MGTLRLRGAACAVVALAAALALAPDTVRADGAVSPAPEPVLKGVEKAAGLLAKAGRKADVAEALDLLGRLGADAAAVTKVRASCDKTIAKLTKPAATVPEAAKTIRRAAADLAATLPLVDEAERAPTAERVLRLDGTVAAAHEALGRVEHEGRWMTRETRDCVLRRREIEALLAASRRLPIEVETGEGFNPAVLAVTGKKGIYVRSGGLTLHSAAFPQERLERMLRDILRATAFSHAVRKGDLAVPPPQRAVQMVLLGSGALFQKAVDESVASGGVAPDRREFVSKLRSYLDARGHVLVASPFENAITSIGVYHLWSQQIFQSYGTAFLPPLEAGHLNWVLLSALGAPIPGLAWQEETGGGKAGRGTTSDRDPDEEARQVLFRLARGGIAGTRAWMTFLARRGEDPAWSRSFVDQVGKIEGADLAKTTMVVEFLQEIGRFETLARATLEKAPQAEAIEKELGEKLGEFEHRWRSWLLPCEPGFAERLDGGGPSVVATAADRALLDRLDRMRLAAQYSRDADRLRKLELDPELTAGCRLHAQYLGKHPEQAAAWPDAHEEYSDREGFTTQGARAGNASVIAPGVRSADEAIDGWMGTFYHRLPLLDPGLIRVGFGLEKGNAVLDTGSMVAPMDIGTWCVWPPADAKDVPRRFNPELPNPVPGADQAAWGYPVTLQFFGWDEEPPLRVALLLAGKPVDCHVSTPRAPTNPELAPDGAWCLIPKQTLLPGATYTVVAEGVPQVDRLEWRFTTATK